MKRVKGIGKNDKDKGNGRVAKMRVDEEENGIPRANPALELFSENSTSRYVLEL